MKMVNYASDHKSVSMSFFSNTPFLLSILLITTADKDIVLTSFNLPI